MMTTSALSIDTSLSSYRPVLSLVGLVGPPNGLNFGEHGDSFPERSSLSDLSPKILHTSWSAASETGNNNYPCFLGVSLVFKYRLLHDLIPKYHFFLQFREFSANLGEKNETWFQFFFIFGLPWIGTKSKPLIFKTSDIVCVEESLLLVDNS